jgi:hypothetical protein
MLGARECVTATAKARPQRRSKIGSGRRESRVSQDSVPSDEKGGESGEVTVILVAPRDFVVL